MAIRDLFRKKSLDKIKSPENLNEYIKVSNPGVWLLLCSVIVLLAGACVWGVFGHVDSTMPADVRVGNGTAVCYVESGNVTRVKPGMTVEYDGNTAVIGEIGTKEERGYYACTLSAEALPADGDYEGKIVVGQYTPLSFVLN